MTPGIYVTRVVAISAPDALELAGAGLMEPLKRHSRDEMAARGRIVTDLAALDATSHRLAVVEIVDGLGFDEIQKISGVPLLSQSVAAHGTVSSE